MSFGDCGRYLWIQAYFYEKIIVFIHLGNTKQNNNLPITFASTRFQESVSFLEEEVIFLKLLLFLRGKLSKSVVSTLELFCEVIEGDISESLNFLSLFSRDVSSEWDASEISGDSDSC